MRVHTTFAQNKTHLRKVTLKMTKAERSSSKKRAPKRARAIRRRRPSKSPSVSLCNPTPLLSASSFSPSVAQSPVNTNDYLFHQHSGDSRKLSWTPTELETISEFGIDTFGSHLGVQVEAA
mmetsp:Transcript_9595/g.39173  ORF Transcript_9595/g.39173 Transcript_9595/m.39173 type:complete len:121 (-) Transcript_9595:396-758(-)